MLVANDRGVILGGGFGMKELSRWTELAFLPVRWQMRKEQIMKMTRVRRAEQVRIDMKIRTVLLFSSGFEVWCCSVRRSFAMGFVKSSCKVRGSRISSFSVSRETSYLGT